MRCAFVGIALLALICSARTASAQVTPAAGYTPPDDTPSIRVGVTLFANYTYQTEPKIVDAENNSINRSAFDITRAYINVTGNISHIVAFRLTPDVSRETNTASSLSGSIELRIKYAYLQTNFDDWMTKGSWARFGIQQTPYLDYTEGIYRYRFQGTMFVERTGYFASADAGASFHWSFPANYGDVHVGVFNGENYNKAEVNDQKAIMVRATVRPFAAMAPILRGFRATVFYDGDNYLKNAERTRALGQLTFEHKYAAAGFEYLSAKDQTVSTRTAIESSGYSIWVTPKFGAGWEGLYRYDHLTPNTIAALEFQKQNRTIVGAAYWFPHQGGVSTALMLDYDAQSFKNLSTAPTKSVAVHALVNF
jgi:Phosphate-selective porin O and P